MTQTCICCPPVHLMLAFHCLYWPTAWPRHTLTPHAKRWWAPYQMSANIKLWVQPVGVGGRGRGGGEWGRYRSQVALRGLCVADDSGAEIEDTIWHHSPVACQLPGGQGWEQFPPGTIFQPHWCHSPVTVWDITFHFLRQWCNHLIQLGEWKIDDCERVASYPGQA